MKLNNNIFLKSELSDTEKNKDFAKFDIIPVPLERTVSYGKGTSMGPQAIIQASNELERYTGKSEPCLDGIYTHPFLDCDKSIDTVINELQKLAQSVSSQNKIPVILGGEHSITYGAVNGIFKGLELKNKNEIGILQIDAHADLREKYENEVHSHASVMYLLSEEKYKILQCGVRALSKEEEDNRKKFQITSYSVEEINRSSELSLPENFPKKIYISFDLDGLDPSIMPATGTPVPGGLGFNESLELIQKLIKDREIVGFDVVELSPIKGFLAYDFTAATLVYKIMELINLNSKE